MEVEQTAVAETPAKVIETRLLEVPGGIPDLDAPVRVIAAAAEAISQPIRMRLYTGLFLPRSKKQYAYWKGVHWKMEFSGLQDVIEFREALVGFIDGWFKARAIARANSLD